MQGPHVVGPPPFPCYRLGRSGQLCAKSPFQGLLPRQTSEGSRPQGDPQPRACCRLGRVCMAGALSLRCGHAARLTVRLMPSPPSFREPSKPQSAQENSLFSKGWPTLPLRAGNQSHGLLGKKERKKEETFH